MVRPMPTPTDTQGAPSWAADYIEGLDSMAHDRWLNELEEELPGVTKIMDDLISGLPGQDSGTEAPIGAAIALRDEHGVLQIISKSYNQVNKNGQSGDHAEEVVMREAAAKLGDKHIGGEAVLISTCELCMGCTGRAIDYEIDTVVRAASHDDVRGKHMRINGEYKRFRGSPQGFDSDEIMRQQGITVVSGFMGKQALSKMVDRTHGSWASFYLDPDATSQS